MTTAESGDEHERCAQCGFDGETYTAAELVETLRGLGPRWRTLLHDAGPDVRTRPAPGVWSAVEYAAHSRDITALHCFGVEQALTGLEPKLPGIEADALIETAAENYAAEDPQTVADAIEAQAVHLADLADGAPPEDWQHGLTIGTERVTVERLVEHALHDSLHHLDDVERGLGKIRT